jgi:hypothetical protein
MGWGEEDLPYSIGVPLQWIDTAVSGAIPPHNVWQTASPGVQHRVSRLQRFLAHPLLLESTASVT